MVRGSAPVQARRRIPWLSGAIAIAAAAGAAWHGVPEGWGDLAAAGALLLVLLGTLEASSGSRGRAEPRRAAARAAAEADPWKSAWQRAQVSTSIRDGAGPVRRAMPVVASICQAASRWSPKRTASPSSAGLDAPRRPFDARAHST